eukprot:Pgem_evm1s15071
MSDLNTINRFIEKQSELNPNSPALTFKDNNYNYNELNNLATVLANKLISLNSQKRLANSRVCVVMNRHEGLVISLLAIFKTKACYV